MTEKDLVRWKAGFFFCSVAFAVLIVFFVLSGEITFSNLNQPMIMISNSNNRSADSRNPSCTAFDRLSFSAKNTTRENCSVSVFKSTNQTEYYSLNSSCPLCTSALFKKQYRTHSAFIADGYWDVLTSGNKIRSATFRPPFCSFTHRDLDPNVIRTCFSKRRIRKIVALGDSIGRMTFTGMKAVLASSGVKQCDPVKVEKEGYYMNISYYLPPGKYVSSSDFVSIGRRGCHSCYGRQFRCFYENMDTFGRVHNASVVLEYLPLGLMFDSSVRILKPIAGFRPTNYTQEFLFRDYLGKNGQPDVVIIVAPFLHEVRAKLERHGKAGLKGSIRNLERILNKYLPRSTQVYWVPSHSIFGGSAAELEAVRRCNQDLYEVVNAEVGAEGNRMHGTLDQLSLSCPLVELSLRNDPVHMQPKWYEIIGKHLLELLCN